MDSTCNGKHPKKSMTSVPVNTHESPNQTSHQPSISSTALGSMPGATSLNPGGSMGSPEDSY